MKWITRDPKIDRIACPWLIARFIDEQPEVIHGFVLYDALYAWCKDVRDETHTWNPQRAPAVGAA